MFHVEHSTLFRAEGFPMSALPPKSKSRLGRGLSSLISISDLPVEAETPEPTARSSGPFSTQPLMQSQPVETTSVGPIPAASTDIALASISPNPHQPRRQFDEVSLQSLAASIKSTGLVQPIIVRQLPAGEGGEATYQLIAGERRLRAAKVAGLTHIPALLRDVDPFAQAQMALVENIQREDLNPIDRALAYRALISQLGLTQSELAGRLGEERSSVANYLRLLDLADPIREMIKAGELSLGHAKILAGVSDPIVQQSLAKKVVQQGLSVRSLEKLLEAPPATEPTLPAKENTAHIRDLEKTITSTLGMKVQLRATGKKGRGKLTIHYATLDQFDGLLEKLGVRPE